MKYLRKFKQILEIAYLCQKYDIDNYTINKDDSIDINGNVYLCEKGLTKLPLKFRNVTGNFYCFNNQLVNLEGAPQSVGGIFDCSYNQLTTLEGNPQSVGSSFDCSYNQLTTLEGAPQSVGGNFYCYDNQLVNLEFAPSCKNIFCSDNPIYRWWDMVNDITKLDAFIDLGIDTSDPDFMNQEKIDLLK